MKHLQEMRNKVEQMKVHSKRRTKRSELKASYLGVIEPNFLFRDGMQKGDPLGKEMELVIRFRERLSIFEPCSVGPVSHNGVSDALHVNPNLVRPTSLGKGVYETGSIRVALQNLNKSEGG